MEVYNQNKTEILTEYDLTKGYLTTDYIDEIIPEVQAVQEQGHYVTIAEYPNGGKDVEWVVDVAGAEYQPERIEKVPITVYVPFTEEQLKQQQINTKINRLTELTKDFAQVQAGLIITDIEERKQEFRTLLNEVRVLQGKQPREINGG